MNSLLNPIAEYGEPDSGIFVLPERSTGLEKDVFFCPDHDCRDPERKLIRKPSINGNLFFSHRGSYSHNIRPEILLHKLAIRWFVGKTEYELPAAAWGPGQSLYGTRQIDPGRTVCEYRFLQSIIPDVKLCTVAGEEFAIEIFVSNDVSAKKAKQIKSFKLPTLRVDLSGFYKVDSIRCRTDYSYVAENLDRLLKDISLKKWVIHLHSDENDSRIDSTPKEDNNDLFSRVISVIPFVIAIVCLRKMFRKYFRSLNIPFKKSKKRQLRPKTSARTQPKSRFPRKRLY